MNNITITKEFTRKAKDLSPAALVLALQLANYIGNTGLLVDSNGKLLIIQDIQKLSGYSVRTTKRSMAELAKQEIYNRTRRGKTNVYSVNPMYIGGAK
jgi:predicted transcriptional regulator